MWRLSQKEYKGQGSLLPGEESEPGYRTKIERTTQVLKLVDKLNNVTGLHNGLSGIKEFKKRGNEFIKTGKRWEGKIVFNEDPRLYMNVLLHPKKTVECSISLKNHKMGLQYGKS